jgi:hypothetical protein
MHRQMTIMLVDSLAPEQRAAARRAGYSGSDPALEELFRAVAEASPSPTEPEIAALCAEYSPVGWTRDPTGYLGYVHGAEGLVREAKRMSGFLDRLAISCAAKPTKARAPGRAWALVVFGRLSDRQILVAKECGFQGTPDSLEHLLAAIVAAAPVLPKAEIQDLCALADPGLWERDGNGNLCWTDEGSHSDRIQGIEKMAAFLGRLRAARDNPRNGGSRLASAGARMGDRVAEGTAMDDLLETVTKLKHGYEVEEKTMYDDDMIGLAERLTTSYDELLELIAKAKAFEQLSGLVTGHIDAEKILGKCKEEVHAAALQAGATATSVNPQLPIRP